MRILNGLRILFGLVVGVVYTSVVIAITPAETVIQNVATAVYKNDVGLPFTTVSNTIDVDVRQIFAIRVQPDGTREAPGQTISSTSGKVVTIPYTLTNPGNGVDTYTLSVETTELLDIRLIIDDTQNNSIVASGQEYNNDAPPTLNPGQTIPLLVTGVIPADQPEGRIFMNLSGFSNGDSSKTDTENFTAIDITADALTIVVDDTDDNGAFTGDGIVSDPDDVMRIEEVQPGTIVMFLNEVWNLGDSTDAVNLSVDNTQSANLPTSVTIEFQTEQGEPLPDNDNNGDPDTGNLQPGENFPFITRVGLPPGVESESIVIAVRGTSQNDDSFSDLTFNIISSVSISGLNPDNVVIQATILVGSTTEKEALVGERVIAYEFDDAGNQVRTRIFLTDESGILLFDEFGEVSPLTTWMRDGFQYRLTLDGEFKNFTYFLTPAFFKSDFDAVTEPGDTFTRGEITITVADDGSRVLEAPLDPAGFVFDAVTGEKINGACATFNRCDDGPDCSTFTPVDVSRLDLLPDGTTFQENPQVTGPDRAGGVSVGTGKGAFQFQFAVFRDADVGYYFVGIDFDCGDPASNPALADQYDPVGLNNGSVWDPFSGNVYTGEPFFVDRDFPQASLLRVPLVPVDFDPLDGEKTVTPASALAGEPLQFTISVQNNTPYTVYNPQVIDELPPTLRYSDGSTRIDDIAAEDPVLANGEELLTWRLPANLGPGEGQSITFTAQVEADSELGNQANIARAVGSTDADDSIQLISDAFEANFDVQGFDPLVVEKTVTPFSASIGDLLLFTIVARNNNGDRVVFNPTIVDQLPSVLRYRNGSTRIDDVRTADPQISTDGHQLTWNVSDLEAGQSVIIKFYAVITGAAPNKTFDNTAVADGSVDELDTLRLTSNTAFARFKVVEGVFTDRAYIVGKVFFDDNQNRIQDHNEQGIEGVKVYTEFGRYVVTDSEGKYHLDNVKPGSHILKLDSTTIPPYSIPELLTNRHFENGEAMCVDVFPGDVFKANFGLISQAPAETTESWQHPTAGLVTFQRTFFALQRDASSGIVRLRHQINITNTSPLPLYEFVYSEKSSYQPLSGSCYLNDAPFKDPRKKSEQFFWLLPLLEPQSSFAILFASEIPKEASFTRAGLAFQKEPFSEVINLVAKIPASLAIPQNNVYRITSYFNAGETKLSPDAYELVYRLGMMLNRLPFERLFVRIQEYPDGDPATALQKQLIQDNTLKKKRKEDVKHAFAQGLSASREIVFE